MDSNAINLVLLGARVALGAMLVYHGVRKLQSIGGTAGWFHGIGMRPGRFNAVLAGSTETGAGLLMAVGLLTSFAATAFVSLMVVAAVTTHWKNGFLIIKEGWEYVLIVAVFAIVVATLGPGEWSLDDAIGVADDLDGWTGLLLAGVGGALAAVGQMGVFYRPGAVED